MVYLREKYCKVGIIHFDTSKITHLARVIISERKSKTTPNDGIRASPATLFGRCNFTPSKKLEITAKKRKIQPRNEV